MHHFIYRGGILHAENVALPELAKTVGTPFYCYASTTLEQHYKSLVSALADIKVHVHYAVKANSNLAVVQTLANLGSGADVVSEGELRLALEAGIPAERIIFSGVGKTKQEIVFALQKGIFQINVESEQELDTINQLASCLDKVAPVAIRVNPDVNADTYYKITTGCKENKFGIEWSYVHQIFQKASNLRHITIVGLATHIGSQITKRQPFHDAFLRLRSLVDSLEISGLHVQRVDLGGGLGVPYEDSALPELSLDGYVSLIRDIWAGYNCQILLEPGRLIVASAGVLVTRVLYIKKTSARTFVIVDAAMNDFIRPALYNAFHSIFPIFKPSANSTHFVVDIVGPVCETSDTFAHQRLMPQVKPGDLLAIATAGAYGASMASSYNQRPLVPEILVKGDQFFIVRRRPSYQETRELERLPPWLV